MRGRPFVQRVVQPEELLLKISSLLPMSLPAHIRDDVRQEIVLAVLTGEIRYREIGSKVREFISRVFKLHPARFGPVSLDAIVPGTDNLRLIDTIESDRPHF